MDRAVLENIIAGIDGGALAILDATTHPHPAITKVTTGKRVLLFTNKNGSDYERIVRRRLVEVGKNPNNFELHDPKWGVRVIDTPLIEHRGKTYLQCIDITEGQSEYFMLGERADPNNLGLPVRRHNNQGLPPEEQVNVSCYDIANIDRLIVLKDVPITSDGNAILPSLVVM